MASLLQVATRMQQLSYFLQIRQYDKKGGVSVAHIADDIQKQSKAFYLQYI